MKLTVNCTAVNGNSKILINPTAENQDLFSALVHYPAIQNKINQLI